MLHCNPCLWPAAQVLKGHVGNETSSTYILAGAPVHMSLNNWAPTCYSNQDSTGSDCKSLSDADDEATLPQGMHEHTRLLVLWRLRGSLTISVQPHLQALNCTCIIVYGHTFTKLPRVLVEPVAAV